MDRIAQLEEFLREDPDDAFSTYALALEYLKTDRNKAYELFGHLAKQKPDYLPTYYPFAQLLIDLQQFDKAESTFKQGIEVAMRNNDQKTYKELSSAYNDWLFERLD